MNKLLCKMQKRAKMTYESFKQDCHISIVLACLRMSDDIVSRLHLKSVAQYLNNKKHNWIMNYLLNVLDNEIDSCKGQPLYEGYEKNAPIWICWWTGMDSAPSLVKKCIKSIQSHANGHTVTLITKDNYSKFLEIPEFILRKMLSGQMCIANFTDYLRFALLEKYGGLWLDATMYVTGDLPEQYFAEPLFTCKSPEIECGYISRFRWTSFCFGGWKQNVLFSFFRVAFEKYWKEHDVAIDYLFVDYLINIAYEKIPTVKYLLENVPVNNLNRDDLQAAMNAALPAKLFDDVVKPETILYKLSWRETYSLETKDGLVSIYSYFLQMNNR